MGRPVMLLFALCLLSYASSVTAVSRRLKKDKETDAPSPAPTRRPTVRPTPQPTPPTPQPTRRPTRRPTPAPTVRTPEPTDGPTEQPTRQPTPPTSEPTRRPTRRPTPEPTVWTPEPTDGPTEQPTPQPLSPTAEPTIAPAVPDPDPTAEPTLAPTSQQPTPEPSTDPLLQETTLPTSSPVQVSTALPTSSNVSGDSPAEAPTSNQTEAPTSSDDGPIANATKAPSKAPTIALSLNPSDIDLEFPTLQPSFSSPGSTLDPTEQDVFVPPSSSPSDQPLVRVRLDDLNIDFLVVDAQSVNASLVEREVESFVVDAMTQMFSTAYVNFDHAEADARFSTFSRRALQESFSVQVSSDAYFVGFQAPSSEELSRKMKDYLANFGDSDLELHLRETAGLETVDGLEVSINGIPVGVVDTDQSKAINTSSNEPSAGLIAGLTVACVALVAAVGLIYWQRKRLTRHASEEASVRHGGDLATDPHTPVGATPRTFPAAEADDSDDDESDITSLYTRGTTGTVATASSPVAELEVDVSAPKSMEQGGGYDVSRLDKVIHSAQQLVLNEKDETGDP